MALLPFLQRQFFYHQLYILSKAEVPLDQAIETMTETQPIMRYSKILKKISISLREGKRLSVLMRDHSDFFTSYECDIIEYGEKSVSLNESLSWLAELCEEMSKYGKVKSASFLFLISTTIIGALILLLFSSFVIPVFEEMFADFGAQLPIPTQFVLIISDTVKSNFLYLFAAAGLLFYSLKRISNSITKWRYFYSLAITYLPWIGKKWIYFESIRMSYILGKSLQLGVPYKKAIEGSTQFIRHPYLKYRLRTVIELLNQGQTWTIAFKSIRKFPRIFIAFIHHGEIHGDLEQAFLEISRSEPAKHTGAMYLEYFFLFPLFAFIIIFFVFMVISMYLPVFKMAGALT